MRKIDSNTIRLNTIAFSDKGAFKLNGKFNRNKARYRTDETLVGWASTKPSALKTETFGLKL